MQAVLGCAIPIKGEETFVQLVTVAPLLEGKVLVSMIGPTEEETIRSAMAAVGVTELVERPKALPAGSVPESASCGLLAALTALSGAVETLTGAIRGR